MTRTRLSITTAHPIRQTETETEQRVCSTGNAVLFQAHPRTQVAFPVTAAICVDDKSARTQNRYTCTYTGANPDTFIYTLESKQLPRRNG